jgi:hypothetical protein
MADADLTVTDSPLMMFALWHELAIQLMVFSRQPAAIEWSTWFCGEFLPALNRHGYL